MQAGETHGGGEQPEGLSPRHACTDGALHARLALPHRGAALGGATEPFSPQLQLLQQVPIGPRKPLEFLDMEALGQPWKGSLSTLAPGCMSACSLSPYLTLCHHRLLTGSISPPCATSLSITPSWFASSSSNSSSLSNPGRCQLR